MAGDRRALPTLLELAKSGYVTVEGQKISELRANAAVDFARLAGAGDFDQFKALVDKEEEAAGLFGEAARPAAGGQGLRRQDRLLRQDAGRSVVDPGGKGGLCARASPVTRPASRPCWPRSSRWRRCRKSGTRCTRRCCSRWSAWPTSRCERMHRQAGQADRARRKSGPAARARAACWPRPGWRWPIQNTEPGAAAARKKLAGPGRTLAAPATSRAGKAGQGAAKAAKPARVRRSSGREVRQSRRESSAARACMLRPS